MSKKYFYIIIFCTLITLGGVSFLLRHQTEPCQVKGDGFVELTIFYSDSCHVCAGAKEFLEGLQERYPEVKLIQCPVANKSVVKKLVELYEKYQVPKELFGRVPAIFTAQKYFIGFDETMTSEIESCVLVCKEAVPETDKEALLKTTEKTVNIPVIGEIDPTKYSLPTLAVILGFFDGFNVCSLGALILILGLVLMLRSRKKILLFGGIFIVTTAVIYGLLILVWYRIFSVFVPYIKIMEVLVGLLGVGGGIYFLQSFLKFRRQGPVCQVETGKGIMSRFSDKIKTALVGGTSLFVLMTSILLFAVVITVVEFPCSAAVPGFFAGMLAKAGLSTFQYLSYIAIFVLFYMADEIIVFLIAVSTLTIKLASKKFLNWITLVEAVILFLLGSYYLFGFLIF